MQGMHTASYVWRQDACPDCPHFARGNVSDRFITAAAILSQSSLGIAVSVHRGIDVSCNDIHCSSPCHVSTSVELCFVILGPPLHIVLSFIVITVACTHLRTEKHTSPTPACCSHQHVCQQACNADLIDNNNNNIC